MNYLSVEQLSKSYNERILFENVTFGIEQGQKVALVGKNGCGKSTLMRIIAGLESPEQGNVVFRKGLKVSFLSQNPEFEKHLTIKDYIFDQDNELLALISEYEQFIDDEGENNDSQKYEELVTRMDALSAWDYETNVKQILGKLGIHHLDQYTDELSGGQRKRVALAAALIEKPDFLILDEPTNHLDIEVIEWLEKYLASQTMSLLLVTHDRYFLEEVTNEIIEIDDGIVYSYKGNYSYFLEKKADRRTKEEAEITKARNLLVKELDWLRRMPKARGTKAKYRIDAAHELQKTADRNIEESSLTLKINTQRLGKKIMELERLSKSWDDLKLIENFDYVFKKNEKVGVVGKNGVGKTTFLDLLTGNLVPDSGNIIKGETIKIGYYRQEEVSYPANYRVIDVVKEVAEMVQLSDGATISAAQFLQHFLFSYEMHYTPVEKLSGGEKRRLQLLRVLIEAPNFLILDEPTNDLDIYTMNVLEDFLLSFEGVLIVVSHDRYFMDKLTEHLFVFEGEGKISDFPGNYSDYKNHLQQENKSREPEKVPKKKEKPDVPAKKNKLSYKERCEYESLEQEIEELEGKKKILIDQLNSGSGDHEQLMSWSREIEEITDAIEQKSDRWLELSEFA